MWVTFVDSTDRISARLAEQKISTFGHVSDLIPLFFYLCLIRRIYSGTNAGFMTCVKGIRVLSDGRTQGCMRLPAGWAVTPHEREGVVRESWTLGRNKMQKDIDNDDHQQRHNRT